MGQAARGAGLGRTAPCHHNSSADKTASASAGDQEHPGLSPVGTQPVGGTPCPYHVDPLALWTPAVCPGCTTGAGASPAA